MQVFITARQVASSGCMVSVMSPILLLLLPILCQSLICNDHSRNRPEEGIEYPSTHACFIRSNVNGIERGARLKTRPTSEDMVCTNISIAEGGQLYYDCECSDYKCNAWRIVSETIVDRVLVKHFPELMTNEHPSPHKLRVKRGSDSEYSTEDGLYILIASAVFIVITGILVYACVRLCRRRQNQMVPMGVPPNQMVPVGVPPPQMVGQPQPAYYQPQFAPPPYVQPQPYGYQPLPQQPPKTQTQSNSQHETDSQ